MSIKDNLLKIKSFSWLFLIIGITMTAFFSGKIYAFSKDKPAILLSSVDGLMIKNIQNTSNIGNIPTQDASNEDEGSVVASKNGKSYHFPWCSGAKRISPENKIFFASKTEAEKAGYEPAKNCKGLTIESL